MEMKDNDQKKMLLSVLGVAILVVAVIGISFAAYSTVFKSGANTVTTGTVMVSYTEPSNAILVNDAMPMSDSDGKGQTGRGIFEFTVSTKADNALTVPYEINLTKVESEVQSGETGYYESMLDSQVKAYLTKGGTYVSETGQNGTLVSALTASTVRNGAKVLHTDSDVFTAQSAGTAVTTTYQLRLWIASTINYDDVSGKEYHAKVNVDSHVNPVSA
ncbi:MAG: hypothetical protein IJL74_04235 [Bacilli bacterium]|nr:hypothetical protein [Bacilli bacterium]